MAQHQRPSKRDVRFRFNIPTINDDGSPIPAEWHLRCLKCEYDLTGLTSRHCPECGSAFKPYEIWVANRRKQADLYFRTPAYVPYGVLAALMLLALPVIRDNPLVLVPFGLLPVYEAAAHWFRWDPSGSRTIMIVLAVIASITVWAMLP
ncbi:MAG: hypothetical protein HY718_09985 [Planctomycetes bacterium]|nr:hypothetical protein [Planctomycetota bacterium]